MTRRRLNPTILAAFGVLCLMTLVQEAIIPQFTVSATRPDLVLLAVIDWTLMRGLEEGMLWGFVGGLFVDLFSGLPYGTSAAGYVAAAGVVSLGQSTLMRTHLLLPILAALVGTTIYCGVSIIVVASTRHMILLDPGSLRIFGAVALYNGVVNFALYGLARTFERRLHPLTQATW